MNDTPSEVAVEQWIWFHQVGMTNREIMSACQMHYEMGMTVDEVIAEMVSAWLGLWKSTSA